MESLLEQAFPVSAFVGTLLVIAGVVGLFHLAFVCNFDQKFWKELFFDTGYDSILWVRTGGEKVVISNVLSFVSIA